MIEHRFESLNFCMECSFIGILSMVSSRASICLSLLIEVNAEGGSGRIPRKVNMEARITGASEGTNKTHFCIRTELKSIPSPAHNINRGRDLFALNLHRRVLSVK